MWERQGKGGGRDGLLYVMISFSIQKKTTTTTYSYPGGGTLTNKTRPGGILWLLPGKAEYNDEVLGKDGGAGRRETSFTFTFIFFYSNSFIILNVVYVFYFSEFVGLSIAVAAPLTPSPSYPSRAMPQLYCCCLCFCGTFSR